MTKEEVTQPYTCCRKRATAEFSEKKSRFIGDIAPIETEEDARAFLARIKAARPDASHHCYAYITRSGAGRRCSDDGEPGGTAGRPILEVLEREGLTGVACVVTRYFGGVLLGAGGLTRAYARAAHEALKAAGKEVYIPYGVYKAVMGYTHSDRALRLIGQRAAVDGVDYLVDVTVTYHIADGDGGLAEALTDLCAGAVDIKKTGVIWLPKDKD